MERRKRLAEILLNRRYEKTYNLAFELGVSPKTIQRDLIEINGVIPIWSKAGRYDGGIYVLGDFSTRKRHLKHNEMRVLIKIKEFIDDNPTGSFDEADALLIEMMIEKYSNPFNSF